MSELAVRDYRRADESDWLRCRVLAFLATSYFDDVVTSKPTYEAESIELVARRGAELVGVLDIAVTGDVATIETVAVHPDASRTGAGSALLVEAIRRLPRTVGVLDAWTREDAAANAWYLSQGFAENFRYLHVFAGDGGEIERAVTATPGLTAVSGFFHARIDEEVRLRDAFRRVHICRQYVRTLDRSGGEGFSDLGGALCHGGAGLR